MVTDIEWLRGRETHEPSCESLKNEHDLIPANIILRMFAAIRRVALHERNWTRITDRSNWHPATSALTHTSRGTFLLGSNS